MANKLLNATFLDGAENWTAGAAIATDEAVVGAPGRIVLTGTSSLISDALPLGAGAGVHAFGGFIGDALSVRFLDGADATVATTALPLTRPGVGAARRGLPGSFNQARGYIPKPVGATQYQLRVAGTGTVALLKPYASADGLEPCGFQPGPHENLDLNYPAWPADLPAIMDDGLQIDPVPTRKGFSGDTGVESTRRTTTARRYRMQAQLALTMEEHDRMMQFFDANPGTFWIVRPGTDEVCLAQWMADGEPVSGGRLPGRRRVQIKLQLRVP